MDRETGSMVGLRRATRPTIFVSLASNSTVCPTRTALARRSGTAAASSRISFRTRVNISPPRAMCSPFSTNRFSITPAVGASTRVSRALMDVVRRREFVAARRARAVATAFRAVRRSVSGIAPALNNCCDCSRFHSAVASSPSAATRSATALWAVLSCSVDSKRASSCPARTKLPSRTYTPCKSPSSLARTSTVSIGRSVPVIATPSTRVDRRATVTSDGAMVRVCAGRPPARAPPACPASALGFEQAAAARTSETPAIRKRGLLHIGWGSEGIRRYTRESECLRWPAESAGVGRRGEIEVIDGACFIGAGNRERQLCISDLELRREPARLAELGEPESLEGFRGVLTASSKGSPRAIELCSRRRGFTRHALAGLGKLEIRQTRLSVGQIDCTFGAKSIEQWKAHLNAEGFVSEPASILRGADTVRRRVSGARNGLEASARSGKSIEGKGLRAHEACEADARKQVRFRHAHSGMACLRNELGRPHCRTSHRDGIAQQALDPANDGSGVDDRSEPYRLIEGKVDQSLQLDKRELHVASRLNGNGLDVRALHSRAQHVVSRCPPRAQEFLDLRQSRAGQGKGCVLNVGEIFREHCIEIGSLNVERDLGGCFSLIEPGRCPDAACRTRRSQDSSPLE